MLPEYSQIKTRYILHAIFSWFDVLQTISMLT